MDVNNNINNNNNTNYGNTNYNNTNNNNVNYNMDYNNTYNYNTNYNNMNYNNTGSIPTPEVQKAHRVRGIIGALGGALLGGVIWTLIGCLGYVSGYIAILIFVLANGGYNLFSKKQETFGIVISVIFGLITIIPATYCAFAFNLMKELSEGLKGHFTYWEVLVDLPMYMERYDLWGNFLGNLAQGYIFTIIVAIFFIAGAVKKR